MILDSCIFNDKSAIRTEGSQPSDDSQRNNSSFDQHDADNIQVHHF